MRIIIALAVALAIAAPIRQASAHDGWHKGDKSRSYKKKKSYKSSKKKYDSSTQAELDEKNYVSPIYDDYPVWAGLAFSPPSRP